MSDNPFAPPTVDDAAVAPAGDAWAEGDLLVTRPTAVLPLVCVKCGTRESVAHVRFHQQWVAPWVRATVAISPLLYFGLYYFLRKPVDVQVGLCPQHTTERRMGQWGGGAGILAGMGVAFLGLTLEDMFILSIGGVAFVAGLVALVVWGNTIRVQRVTAERAEFTKVHPELLAALSG